MPLLDNIYQRGRIIFNRMRYEPGYRVPLINDPAAGVVSQPYGRPTTPDYKTLWGYFRQTPEVISIITAIAEDIISDGWVLEPIDDKKGRNRVKRAEKFLDDNLAKQEFMSVIIDYLITGDGYIYKSKISEKKAKAVIRKMCNKLPKEYEIKSDEMFREIWFESKSTDEDLFKTRKFLSVPSSTVLADYDEYGVPRRFTQKVGKKVSELTPEEMIHFRYLRLNGEFYGFTPLASLFTEMSILKYIKEMAANHFYRGGIPNYMFVLEEETPDSPNYKRFTQTLEQYAKNKNRSKSLIVTGKVKPEPLNKIDKDMEFRELANYITQVIVMAWNIPAERLSNIIMAKNVKGGTSEEGYYRKISHLQDTFQSMVNRYLLKEFGVKLRFKKAYKQDEVREVQIDKIKTDVVEQRKRLGLVNEEWAWQYLNIPFDKRGTGEPEMAGTPQMNQFPFQQKPMMESNPDKMAADQDRQSTQIDKKSRDDKVLKDLMDRGYKESMARAILENL